MDRAAYRVMSVMVLRFKEVATALEAEIRRYQREQGQPQAVDDSYPVASLKRGIPTDAVIATKAVSHFNLGTSLELMFKLLLSYENKKVPEMHSLRSLYNQLSAAWQRKVLSCYNKAKEGKLECLHVAIQKQDSVGAGPSGKAIKNWQELLSCFDDDIKLSTHRYSWEQMGDGHWVQFMDDITVITDTIDLVMQRISSEAAKK